MDSLSLESGVDGSRTGEFERLKLWVSLELGKSGLAEGFEPTEGLFFLAGGENLGNAALMASEACLWSWGDPALAFFLPMEYFERRDSLCWWFGVPSGLLVPNDPLTPLENPKGFPSGSFPFVREADGVFSFSGPGSPDFWLLVFEPRSLGPVDCGGDILRLLLVLLALPGLLFPHLLANPLVFRVFTTDGTCLKAGFEKGSEGLPAWILEMLMLVMLLPKGGETPQVEELGLCLLVERDMTY